MNNEFLPGKYTVVNRKLEINVTTYSLKFFRFSTIIIHREFHNDIWYWYIAVHESLKVYFSTLNCQKQSRIIDTSKINQKPCYVNYLHFTFVIQCSFFWNTESLDRESVLNCSIYILNTWIINGIENFSLFLWNIKQIMT